VGHFGIQALARSIDIEWSQDALADLDRFSAFLQQHHPDLAQAVAREIVAKADMLSRYPRMGRPIAGQTEYRQLVLQVLNAPYIFQYRFDGRRLVMLRIFHGRETRD
jgi:plasmid stabilization system protein ParE